MNETDSEDSSPSSPLLPWLAILKNAYLKGVLPESWPEPTIETADLELLARDLMVIYDFILQLAAGDLSGKLKVKGALAGSLKSLQANLRHMSWQVQKVASGDLTQKIEFMGELSNSFNQMTDNLKKARAELTESEARYRLLAENAADVIWTMNLNGQYTYISPSILQLSGYTVEEAMAQTMAESVSTASLPQFTQRLNHIFNPEAAAETLSKVIFQIEQSHKDGRTIQVEITATGLYDGDGHITGIQGVSRDITERLRTQTAEHEQRILAEALRNTTAALNSAKNLDEVFDSLIENVGQVVPHDTVDILIIDNDGLARIKRSEGYSKFIPNAYLTLNDIALSVESTPNLTTMRDTGQPFLIQQITPENWVTNDLSMWARSHLGTPIMVKGKPVGFFSLLSALPNFFTKEHAQRLQAFADQAAIAIERASLFQQLHDLATTDSLTEIPNRRHFFNLAEQELIRAGRYHRPLAALMMDVDQFKRINDSYGHAVGDTVLQEIARRCKKEMRVIDLFGRYGGEEFAFILPETDANTAQVVADRLRRTISSQPFYARDEAFKVTVSIGVAGFHSNIPSARSLLDLADQALYLAKQSGRNRVTKID